jgi:hypothetical protein
VNISLRKSSCKIKIMGLNAQAVKEKEMIEREICGN